MGAMARKRARRTPGTLVRVAASREGGSVVHRARVDWPLVLWTGVILVLVVLVAIGALAVIAGLLVWVLS
jgi:hypothetical protein